MPKSNLCENKAQKRYDFMAGMIAGGMRQRNMQPNDLSEKVEVSQRTIADHLKNPQRISVEELYKIADAVGLRVKLEYRDIPD